MDAIFLKIVNMSITASWLVLAVLVLRLLLKRVPRAISCVLWVIVALRLIIPFSFESAISLVPSAETIPNDFVSVEKPEIDSGIYGVDDLINPIISDVLARPAVTPIEPGDVSGTQSGSLDTSAPTPSTPDKTPGEENVESETPAKSLVSILSVVWIAGIVLMLVYMLATYVRIKRRVGEAVSDGENIMICDMVTSPFILGVIRPRIYLPSSLDKADREYVLAHERAHLSRRDHLWKPLGFVLLAVYWFNPILWLAYVLLCRDIEIACDEKVIRQMGTEVKKPYSEALINCSMPRRMIAACPLAFGEVGVKGRIKAVLNYKKPAFWIIILAVVAVAVTSVCFLTDPLSEPAKDGFGSYENRIKTADLEMSTELTEAFEAAIKRMNRTSTYKSIYVSIDYTLHGIYENQNAVKVYATVMYGEYTVWQGALITLHEVNETVEISFSKKDNGFALVSYKRPEGEKLYPEGFPSKLDSVADPTKYEEKHRESCVDAAIEYYNLLKSNVDFEWKGLDFGFYPTDEVMEVLNQNNAYTQPIKSYDDALAYYTMLAKATSDSYGGKLEYYSDYNARAAECFAKFKEIYPEEFFNDKALVIIYIPTGSGGDRYGAQAVRYEDGQLTIGVVMMQSGVTCDFNADTIAVSVPREVLDSCEKIFTKWVGRPLA